MAVSDYKTNPDENTTISGINIAEGCPPSGINNAIRQLMADVKQNADEQDEKYGNSSLAEVTATGSDTPRTLADRFADIVNVRDFGAKGDGVTDDTEALNIAAEAAEGKCLYVPKGVYLTSTGLRIPSNTHVRGDGMFNSIIKLTADDFAIPCITNAANIVGKEDENTGNENITVSDLCADGNGYRENGTGSSVHSGCAWSLKNVHTLRMYNCRGIRGRLHCLDIASAKYDTLYNPSAGMDWREGGSDDVIVENFVGEDAAVDDVITTHYSKNIKIINSVAIAGKNRPFAMTFNQCGIEIDDGSENVVVSNCYARGFGRGIACKGHNNGTPEQAALPARNVRFEYCTAEGNNVNYEYLYHGTLLPVGDVAFFNCTSIQPKVVVDGDTEDGHYFYAYGRAESLTVDGLLCRGEEGSSADRCIRINPLASSDGIKNLSIKNVVAQDVNVTEEPSIIRVTGNIGSQFAISGVVADNCGDFPVVYNTSMYLGEINGIRAHTTTPHTSSVIKCNYATAKSGAGFIRDVQYTGYAHALDYGDKYIDSIDNATICNTTTKLPYTGHASEYIAAHRYTLVRSDGNLPTDGGLGIVLAREDSSGVLDDCTVRAVGHYNDAISSLYFGVRGKGEDTPKNRWGIQATTVTAGDTFCWRPAENNAYSVGRSGYRISQVFAANGSIDTSDKQKKQAIESYPNEVLDAWGEVEFRQFLFNDAVERKGDAARIHAGVIAQQLVEVFAKHNLDATRYGLLCYDEWPDEYKDVEVVDVPESELIVDKNGNPFPAQTHTEKVKITKAGSEYGIRYSEALCIEAAYQRRRAQRLEKRVADLETRIAALELR